jgi:hypothetical protein
VKYLIILTDRRGNGGYASSELVESSSDNSIILKSLEPHTTQDIHQWIFEGTVSQLRDHISEERGLEIAILKHESLERVL